MDDHEIEIANSAELVFDIGKQLSGALCDHQAFFVLVLDEHAGAMPAVENVLQRPKHERQRAADVLRMWAARIEKGVGPEKRNA